MKKKLITLLLLTVGSGFGADLAVGVRIGPPPPPRIVRIRPSPGPGYYWVDGYWYPAGKHYKWHDGYWSRPPYESSRWVSPRHDGERFYHGYWEGDRGRIGHDHHWDRDRNRDYDRYDRR
jgi:hypothetical protein